MAAASSPLLATPVAAQTAAPAAPAPSQVTPRDIRPEAPPAATAPSPVVAPPRVAKAKAHRPGDGGDARKAAAAAKACRHCGGGRLHAQHGRDGYFYLCIDCANNTPIDVTCPSCGKKARVRKSGLEFFRECEACGGSALIHTNVPLTSL